MNFFNKINIGGNSGSSFAIDIGTTSIKAIETRSNGEQLELMNYVIFETYGHLERINTALQTSTLKLYDQEVAEYLKLIIRKSGFQAKSAKASIPSFSAFS